MSNGRYPPSVSVRPVELFPTQLQLNRAAASGCMGPARQQVFTPSPGGLLRSQMITTLRRASLFALYQLTVLTGIALLPLALAARRFGVSVPIGRVVDAVGAAYEHADD